MAAAPDHQGAARGPGANRIEWIRLIINAPSNSSCLRCRQPAFRRALADAQHAAMPIPTDLRHLVVDAGQAPILPALGLRHPDFIWEGLSEGISKLTRGHRLCRASRLRIKCWGSRKERPRDRAQGASDAGAGPPPDRQREGVYERHPGERRRCRPRSTTAPARQPATRAPWWRTWSASPAHTPTPITACRPRASPPTFAIPVWHRAGANVLYGACWWSTSRRPRRHHPPARSLEDLDAHGQKSRPTARAGDMRILTPARWRRTRPARRHRAAADVGVQVVRCA